MEATLFKITFLVALLTIAPGAGMMQNAEAREHVKCPRLLHCSDVCQGYPSCCVNGECICQSCASLPPPANSLG
ncbi:hypothetical protein Ancab_020954 [Ancistrocladus abbreviatus]